jgi:hypothetical protein
VDALTFISTLPPPVYFGVSSQLLTEGREPRFRSWCWNVELSGICAGVTLDACQVIRRKAKMAKHPCCDEVAGSLSWRGRAGVLKSTGRGSLLDPRIMDNFHGFSTSMRIDWVLRKTWRWVQRCKGNAAAHFPVLESISPRRR